MASYNPGAMETPTFLSGIAVLVAGSGVALAACGGASGGPVGVGTNPNSANSPLKLSQCMRAHGASGFPDPSAGPGGGVGFRGGLGESNTGVLIVDGKTFSGPAVQHAEQACKSMLPPKGPPPKLTIAQYRRELAFAGCMRAHGAMNFADKGAAGGSNQANVSVEGAPGIGAFDPNAPATKAALRSCGSLVR
jgi:hypothetical protein